MWLLMFIFFCSLFFFLFIFSFFFDFVLYASELIIFIVKCAKNHKSIKIPFSRGNWIISVDQTHEHGQEHIYGIFFALSYRCWRHCCSTIVICYSVDYFVYTYTQRDRIKTDTRKNYSLREMKIDSIKHISGCGTAVFVATTILMATMNTVNN